MQYLLVSKLHLHGVNLLLPCPSLCPPLGLCPPPSVDTCGWVSLVNCHWIFFLSQPFSLPISWFLSSCISANSPLCCRHALTLTLQSEMWKYIAALRLLCVKHLLSLYTRRYDKFLSIYAWIPCQIADILQTC